MNNFFENIEVDNFKVFKDSKSIKLSPINILIGKNNSGKSTLMELMKLIKVSLDQSGLNKLMFSELDGFQSFDDFKTFDYNKDIMKLRIPFELKWFDRILDVAGMNKETVFIEKLKSKFFLELEYKKSKNNSLDGILYKYEIKDNEGETIYRTQRVEWDVNEKNYKKAKKYINDKKLIAGEFVINYEKISKWVETFYDFKIEKLKLLKNDVLKCKGKIDFDKNTPVDEIFKSLSDEQMYANTIAFEKFMKKGDGPKRSENEIEEDDRYFLEQKMKVFEGLEEKDLEDNYHALHLRQESIDYKAYGSGRKRIQKESLLDKDMLEDFSLPMWNEIKQSSLLFEYDNEDGSPITKKQIKLIKKIEENVLKENHALSLNSKEFYERKFDIEVIFDRVKVRLFEAEGKIRIIAYSNEIEEIWMSYTPYGIFINNIIDALSSIPNNLLKYSKINTSDVDTIKDDMTNFLKTIYNNPLEGYQNDFVNKWLKEFTYTDDSDYEIKRVGNDLKIYFNKGEVCIDSYGKGLQELIYLIFNIAKQKKDKESIMLIVEPEAHLHPNFQSLLADMFVDASKEFKIKFIIESHSEYLLRKLQYLTIKGDIKSGKDTSYLDEISSELIEEKEFGDVIVNYFENDSDTNSTIINQIYIDEYGNLSDNLGEGFTDHSSKLIMDTLKLKKK
jgi:predicted ATPase